MCVLDEDLGLIVVQIYFQSIGIGIGIGIGMVLLLVLLIKCDTMIQCARRRLGIDCCSDLFSKY